MRMLKLTAPNSVLLLLCAMYFILYIDRVNIATAAPVIQGDLKLTNTELGFALTAFAYPYTLFQLFGSWLGDRFGARRTLSVSLVVVCIATALTGTVGGLATLFAARVVLGLGEGAALPTATHAMSSWTPKARWGFAQGITHSFARLGNFATPVIVAGLIQWSSWRTSFYVLAGVSLVWMAIWGWYFRDSPAEHPDVTQEDLARLPGRSHPEKSEIPWLDLLRVILPSTAVNFCYGWTLWLFLTWIPSFFVQNYQLDLARSALFASGVFLGGFVGDTAGGVASDFILRRTGKLGLARKSVIIVGFLGGCAAFVPVVLVHDLVVSAVFLSLAFFFAEMIVAPIWAVPMDIAPDHAGTASGMMNFGSALAGIVSPVFFGYVLDLTGTWTVPFLASILLLLVGAIIASYLRPDRPFAPKEESAVADARQRIA